MEQNAGMYDYIEFPYLLAGVKSKLGLRETTSEDLFLIDALNFCLTQKLKNFGVQTYCVTQLQVEDNGGTPRVKLPKGFIRFVKKDPIVYVDASGKATIGVDSNTFTNTYTDADGNLLGSLTVETGSVLTANLYAPTFTNNTFFKDSPFESNLLLGGTVNVQNGYIYFSSNVTAQYVKIAYLGVNFGESGKMLIPAYCEDALVNYAAREWCTTQLAITGEGKYMNLYNIFNKSYIAGKNKAKAIPLMPDSLEYRFLNYIVSSLV
jgi:hypothetical protein